MNIPDYWTEISTGEVYKVTMVSGDRYRLRMCNPKCSADETAFYDLALDTIKERFVEYKSCYYP